MSLQLPDRASAEYLKKLAKERLALMRATDPEARLSDAQLAIARNYGFASWRALKADLDGRQSPGVAELLAACASGDVDAIRTLVTRDPALARDRLPGGTTALHLAARHPAAVQLLIEHGADPNARDTGDNATPLHFAGAAGALESVRMLLDAGADVHGHGDLHDGDVIGWASGQADPRVIDLLLERGARHHIFSAMARRDRDLVRRVVEEEPAQLRRRRSRYEAGHTPVHAAFAPPEGLGFLAGAPDYEMLELLITLGAEVDATDAIGRTPLALALLRNDQDAIRILRAAGAGEPRPALERGLPSNPNALRALARSVKRSSPMFGVRDPRATATWYQSIGFTLNDEYEDGGRLIFARLTFGNSEFTLTGGETMAGPRGVSLWFFTDAVEALYDVLKSRREIPFDEDLYTPFYGGRQFSIRDINELSLIFWQPDWVSGSGDQRPDSAKG